MNRLYDLAVKTREYTDNRGERKAVWHNVGRMMRGNRGDPFLLLNRDFNPAGIPAEEGRDSIIISCFKPKPKDGRQGGGARYTDPNGDNWQQQPSGNWAREESFTFAEGPQGTGEPADIPF